MPIIGPQHDIPAPDAGTDAQVMAWVLDTYSMMVGYQALGVVTGKPIALGGSVGREEATGRGVMNVLRKFLATQNQTLENVRVAVQGFGNVGFHTAQLVDERGATVVAVSEKHGGIYNDKGIDLAAAGLYYRENGTLADFPDTDPIGNDELLACDCDVLIPAAMENTLDAKAAPHVKARVVVEGANGPHHARCRRHPPRQRRHRPPRHPRQRRRRHRQLFRMGAGPGKFLLGQETRGGRTAANHGKSIRCRERQGG